MKYCPNCGTQCPDGATFCTNCGASLQGGAPNGTANNSGYNQNQNNAGYNPNNSGYNQNGGGYYQAPGITPRSIPVCVILSIVTCGIYGIYWMIKLNDEINTLAHESGATSGGIVFLLSIVTCGIYGLYWQYKMGERCDRIKGTAGSTGILYLILAVVGFGIVGYCLMQDTINKSV